MSIIIFVLKCAPSEVNGVLKTNHLCVEDGCKISCFVCLYNHVVLCLFLFDFSALCGSSYH